MGMIKNKGLCTRAFCYKIFLHKGLERSDFLQGAVVFLFLQEIEHELRRYVTTDISQTNLSCAITNLWRCRQIRDKYRLNSSSLLLFFKAMVTNTFRSSLKLISLLKSLFICLFPVNQLYWIFYNSIMSCSCLPWNELLIQGLDFWYTQS